ncbi:MAG: sugar kinase [Clostridiales bacterium]|jgi:2-dehydro-3-deoxygluconokinase|nr:sugar kinase [Clostridiales bacterium]
MKQPKYALICPSSMGVRITPSERQAVHISNTYFMQATSAETNVLSVSSSLGLPVKVLTKFVEGSPIASFIKSDLRSRRIEFEGPDVPQGGAWGFRHQFNIADSGFGARGPRVWNDRTGEVGMTLSTNDFDLERIFAQEGAGILHMSGLVAALSYKTGEFCLDLAHKAKEHGTRVSFDLNYRASFWKGREKELGKVFREIARNADILIGNEEDFQLCLGISGPESGGKDLVSKIGSFKEMIMQVKKEYPGAQTYATTLRQVESANEHLWGAILLNGDTWYVEEPRRIQVLDRIGGGDAFVGGMLYAVAKDWAPERWIKFGWACGALVTTMLLDYALPADEEQVWSIYEGNARVKR